MPDTLPPLRLAFLGGNGHHYMRAALKDTGLTIDAVAVGPGAGDGEAARRSFAPTLDAGATWYDDANVLLDAFKPNLVSVGTLYAHNGDIARLALQRGVPVVSDKPVAGTWESYRALDAALTPQGSPALLTEFDFRSRKSFRAAARAVADGLIGEVVLASAQKSYRFGERPDFYRRREDYGSTLLWIASHGIDAMRFVTGQALTAVFARHGNVAKPDYATMEDHCTATYALGNGGTGLVHADLLRPAAAPSHGDDRFRVVGSLGQLEIQNDLCTLITHDAGPRDLTDTVSPQPIHRELLAAAFHGDRRYYSSAASLELARILLITRDAADTGQFMAIGT